VRGWSYPLGDRPPESVFLLLDPDVGPEKRRRLVSWVETILPWLNWRSHVFVLEDARSSILENGQSAHLEVAEELAGVVSRFLGEHEFATLYMHPLVTVRSGDARQRVAWDRLLAPAKPFKTKAYREQGEARLFISPILTLAQNASAGEALEAAEFFHSRFSTPSFCISGKMPQGLINEGGNRGIRFYVDPGAGGIARQLWVNHVFEAVLDRLGEGGGQLLAPCRGHVVVDERSGGVFACFRQWEEGKPSVSWNVRDFQLPGPAAEEPCPECIGRSLLSMRESLVVNDREKEARQVYFELALTFSSLEDYRLAADLARHAFKLSNRDEDRAAALVQEGLCHLNSGGLQKAEEVLELASTYPADHGLVAFHRGQIQFAWRDYIEALDRFEEALRSGSEHVPVEDICFQMALCHINIEEYSDARRYLDRCLEPGRKVVPVFYLGVCDLGEGRVESAMAHFLEALRMGPAREDLSRVLFNIGTCLKELGRIDEAIDVLEKAVEVDPDDLANHNLLGFCYYKTKRHQRALDCFLRAVEINPRSAIDWANLGSNLRDLGRIDEAVAMYKKAHSLDPTIEFVRVNLARLTNVLEESDC